MLTGRQNSEATAYYIGTYFSHHFLRIDCSLGITARNQAKLLSVQKLKSLDKQLQTDQENEDIRTREQSERRRTWREAH